MIKIDNINAGIKKLRLIQVILTISLLVISFVSFFSFNYYYAYGHITNFAGAAFTFLQWVKLALLVAIPAVVFLRTERFTTAIKWLGIITPLVSLAFIGYYIGLKKTPVNEHQIIYERLNMFMPKWLIVVLFVVEALLMAVIAGLYWVRDRGNNKQLLIDKEQLRKGVLNFLPIFAIVIPLNIFDNLIRLLPSDGGLYKFLEFGSFTIWHFLIFALVFISTYWAYKFLKNKNSASRYRYLCVLSIVLIVQWMNRASMLIGDGYNVYYTLIAFIPLFVCGIGVPIATAAVFTKNKLLHNLSFFVHGGGALSVFFYFGKEGMSNYGTIFNYTFLYFTFTHCVLFMICTLPVLLGEHKFKLKQSIIPMAYYAGVMLVASVVSQIVTNATYNAHGGAGAIEPNFAFTQNAPFENNLPPLNVTLFGLTFDMLYLPILFAVYVGIFTCHYIGYLLVDYRIQKNVKGSIIKERDIAIPAKSVSPFFEAMEEAAITVIESEKEKSA